MAATSTPQLATGSSTKPPRATGGSPGGTRTQSIFPNQPAAAKKKPEASNTTSGNSTAKTEKKADGGKPATDKNKTKPADGSPIATNNANPPKQPGDYAKNDIARSTSGKTGQPTKPLGDGPLVQHPGFKKFAAAMRQRESTGNYQAVNDYGFLGAYQFGTDALIDIGYKSAGGRWTGKHGATSQPAFLNNRNIQDRAFADSMTRVDKEVRSLGLNRYIDTNINGKPADQFGLTAGAHLGGVGGLYSYLTYGKNGKDAYGTSIGSYIKEFSGLS